MSLIRSFRYVCPSTKQTASPCIRTYFSIYHPDPRPFPPAQDRILSAALDRVPQYGFTEDALVLGAKDAGYLDVTVQLFPRGVFDLINYHLVTQRLALKNNVQFSSAASLGLTSKVKSLAMARLRANKNIVHQWQGVRFAHRPTNSSSNITPLGSRPHVFAREHPRLSERAKCPVGRNLVPCW